MNKSTEQNESANLWIVSQHPLVSTYLLQVLNTDPSIRSRVMSGTMPANTDVDPHSVLLLDNSGLDASIAEYIAALSARFTSGRYLVLDHETDVFKICQMLSLGIHGFLLYAQVEESLLLAVRSIKHGGMWIESEVMKRYMRFDKRNRAPVNAQTTEPLLTRREEEILHFTRQRHSNKEIAAMLNIEVSTVKYHLTNIFSKLQIESRSELWRNPSAPVIELPLPGSHVPAASNNGPQAPSEFSR
jgi:two-component system, NarL family, response regulator LiaR